jgi:tRNA G18 (ribose-2'-O)-methylase SpoU
VPIEVQFLAAAPADDERLADYHDLKDRRLGAESGRFVVESEVVVRKLLASSLRVYSLLLTSPRLAALEPALAEVTGDFPIYVVPQPVMDGIAGFHVHRGCLAIAERPTTARVPADARRVIALVDLVDVDNLGAMARNAAAFGADALLLSPRCADPFYRKAVRTSAGAVLSLPIVRARAWPEDLVALREQAGFRLVGAVLGKHARPLHDFEPPERIVLVFGAEGPGLDPETQGLCDHLLTIPMARSVGVDSLNVATAGAIFLYHCTRQLRRR